ncbi:MAG: 50S ribosomal protein L1 [Bacteroidetes bacterium]|nr:50S ribosomal protein L1 [Bacteroidota bacterium]
MKVTKKRKAIADKVEKAKLYTLGDAAALVKKVSTTKFDGSVDLHIRLGVDPRKPDQAIRGTVSLPHGTGKTKSVLVMCTPDKEEEAREAGADYVGLEEFVDKISSGWTDVDVIIATPNVMPKIGRLGKVLGPRNLMPNPKSGTVTVDVANAVKDVKGGKIAFRVDKYGILHSTVGKVSFTEEQLAGNMKELLSTLHKMKPAAAKGVYFKSIFAAPTMGSAVQIDPKSLGF